MDRFRLLQLPSLALQAVLQFLDPYELEILRSIIGQVIEKQKVIKRLMIRENLTEKDMTWILDNLTITDYCVCYVMTSPDFGYKFKTYPRHFSLHGSHWFKLDDLIAAAKSTKVIRLHDSHLDNKDIDAFMKLWTSGNFMTLRYLEVESRNLNQRGQILGRNLIQPWNDEVNWDAAENGVRIRSDDGIKALMEYSSSDHYFTLKVL